MPDLLVEKYERHYNAELFSWSTFITLCIICIIILCPVYIVIYTGNWWNETIIYFEQPNVKYTEDMLIYVMDDTGQRFFSTNVWLNELYPENNRLRIPMIKFQYHDENNDGLNDYFKFHIAFPTDTQTTSIRNIKIALFFDYEFKNKVEGTLHSTNCLIDIDTPLGASYIRINGYLNLKQKAPISSLTFVQTNNLPDRNLFNNNDVAYSFEDIINKFTDKSLNFSTVFEYDKFVIPRRTINTCVIDIIVNVPSFQKILYKQPSMTKFKFFFVQFMAILIPFLVIGKLLLYYMFKNRICESNFTSDLPKLKKL
jgi:hypothetical protein